MTLTGNEAHIITDLLQPPVPMLVTKAQLIPYSIPLKKSWINSTSILKHRQGFLIRLFINDQQSVFGECAPMTDIGTETMAQAQAFLEERLKVLQGNKLDETCLTDADAFPASRFALETAYISLLDKYNNQAFYQRLNPDYTDTIKTNIMLGVLDDSSYKRTMKAEQDGFKCLKFKVGINDIDKELKCLDQIIHNIQSETCIRLDANRSWSIAQTEYVLEQLQKHAMDKSIDSIEEPLLQYNQKAYVHLQSHTNIPLALDESFIMNQSLKELPVKRLVLKPMAHGGILNTWMLAQQAKQYKISTVITSSIETGYGLWPITCLCAALNNDQFHGLATADWLSDTLIQPPEIDHGCIHL